MGNETSRFPQADQQSLDPNADAGDKQTVERDQFASRPNPYRIHAEQMLPPKPVERRFIYSEAASISKWCRIGSNVAFYGTLLVYSVIMFQDYFAPGGAKQGRGNFEIDVLIAVGVAFLVSLPLYFANRYWWGKSGESRDSMWFHPLDIFFRWHFREPFDNEPSNRW